MLVTNTPLTLAVKGGHADLVDEFLKYDQITTECINQTDEVSITLLIASVFIVSLMVIYIERKHLTAFSCRMWQGLYYQ